jgi:hypothetical protein
MRLIDSKKIAAAVVLTSVCGVTAHAATFNVSNTENTNQAGTIRGQGFQATSTSGDPGVTGGTPVFLQQFRFLKAGAVNATNVSLVVFNVPYPDLDVAATNGSIVGTSTNVITDTSTLATDAPIVFDFANLALTYGSNYSVGLFNGAVSTANSVGITVRTADYAEATPGAGFTPVTNYGGLDNFSASAYGGVNGDGFYTAYGRAGDSNFVATLTTEVPEPTALAVFGLGLGVLARRRRD